MKISKHSVVGIDYTLKNEEGQVLDTSAGKEPLLYMHGVGQLIPGLENELAGKTAGDAVNAVIPPADAYGERRAELVQLVPKANFQGGGELKEGIQVQVDAGQGPMVAVVTKIDGETVTLDLNHPLAGVTLYFDVDIKTVREATASEIEHGHAHGADGMADH